LFRIVKFADLAGIKSDRLLVLKIPNWVPCIFLGPATRSFRKPTNSSTKLVDERQVSS